MKITGKGHVLVKEAMKVNPVTVKSNTTVQEAAKIMRKKCIGNCIVADETPIGIITESDILKKIVAEDKRAGQILVK